jgi:hypothetical protein
MQLWTSVRLKVSKRTALSFKALGLIQRDVLDVMAILCSMSAHAILLYVAGRPNTPIIFHVDRVRECF